MFKLVIQDDEGKTTVVPLIRDEITIGRKEGNTIRLTERNVSRRHARILRNNGEVHIEDLGSYNGIRVNNARIAERVSLRVSDQVQIGDYKLYLKTEGVEQADEQRTMPIERVDSASATDVIPAVAPGATQPMGVPQTPVAAASSGVQLVGNPNRTLVAIADTDPQGRPVASAAAVAALTAPVGYGKLVGISSNIAGKEFELSRPQMIVGRTDENDIVINHRSISRNHAKLVREPETGRYTISDLQSSNGVRVNNQDYGKVELRRGDVIDLGHIRLRFVEPGENYVFNAADIVDIPEGGSKKGLLVAIALGVVVLAAVIIVFAMRGDKGNEQKVVTPPGSSGQVDADAAVEQVAVTPGSGSAEPTVPPDAAVAAVDPSDPKAPIYADCLDFIARRKWADLNDCSDSLKKHDPAKAQEFKNQANAEVRNEQSKLAVERAVKANNIKDAQTALRKIAETSVYHAEAKGAYDKFYRETLEYYVSRAQADMKKDKTCRAWGAGIAQAEQQMGKPAGAQIRDAVPCKVEVASSQNSNNNTQKDPVQKDPVVKDPVTPPVACNADALQAAGQAHINKGEHAAALVKLNESYACKPSSATANFAFLAACVSKNSKAAKMYFPKISAKSLTQRCRDTGTDFGGG